MKIAAAALYASAALGFVFFTSTAQAQSVATSPPQRQSASTAWTTTKKVAAKPMPLIEVTGQPQPAPATALQATRATGGGSWPGNRPGEPPVLSAAPSTAPAFGFNSSLWYSYPPPFEIGVPILDYVVAPLYPITALGKLFFQDGATSYVCSAASVTSAGTWGAGNRQTVITAGHCCSNGAGTFYSNWLFEPAHLSGAAPLGSWSANNATVLNDWHLSGDYTRDVCVLQMNTLGGQNVNDAVGALGYAWDLPLPQHYHATGWPAAAPFSGGVLFIVTASDAETDTLTAGALPFTHGIGNSMTGGSSGGAWIQGFQSFTGANNWNGLNSYKYNFPSRPGEMFGPYADFALFDVLLRSAATAPAAP